MDPRVKELPGPDAGAEWTGGAKPKKKNKSNKVAPAPTAVGAGDADAAALVSAQDERLNKMRAWLGKLTGSAVEPAAPTPAAPAMSSEPSAVPAALPKLNLSRQKEQDTLVWSRPASAKPAVAGPASSFSLPSSLVSRPASAAQRLTGAALDTRPGSLGQVAAGNRAPLAASLLSKQQARVILEARMSKLNLVQDHLKSTPPSSPSQSMPGVSK